MARALCQAEACAARSTDFVNLRFILCVDRRPCRPPRTSSRKLRGTRVARRCPLRPARQQHKAQPGHPRALLPFPPLPRRPLCPLVSAAAPPPCPRAPACGPRRCSPLRRQAAARHPLSPAQAPRWDQEPREPQQQVVEEEEVVVVVEEEEEEKEEEVEPRAGPPPLAGAQGQWPGRTGVGRACGALCAA